MRDMNEILNENIHICIIDRPIYKMEKNYFGTFLEVLVYVGICRIIVHYSSEIKRFMFDKMTTLFPH